MHRIARHRHTHIALFAAVACLAASLAAQQPPAQSPLTAGLVPGIEAMVHARYNRVLSFTNLEHYFVYRGQDETHPVAQMTVRVTYRKGEGKSYKILSQSGSTIIRHFGLKPLLENEEAINSAAAVSQSWFTSDNYQMVPDPGRTQTLRGRLCVAVAIKPLHKAPNRVNGTLWVDPANFAILRVEGTPSKSPSIFAGTTHMLRDYTILDGFSQSVRARAESDGLFGHTVVVIRYSDYRIQLAPASAPESASGPTP